MHSVEVLLRKIELRLGKRTQVHQLSLQDGYCSRELAAQRAKCAARCFAARGVDEIGHRLRLREIEATFEKGAPGEFARFGEPRAAIEASAQKLAHHYRSAVAMQFEHVFAGVGVWRREEQRQPLVDRLPVRIIEPRKLRQPWRRQLADDGAGDACHRRAGKPDDADAAASRWRGDCGNGVAPRSVGGCLSRAAYFISAWHGQVCRAETGAGSATAAGWRGCC